MYINFLEIFFQTYQKMGGLSAILFPKGGAEHV